MSVASCLRLLLQHPDVTEIVATSRSQAGKPIADLHPSLAMLTDARFAAHAPAEVSAARMWCSWRLSTASRAADG